MNVRELRKQLGDTQGEFARRYHIPFRTVQNWETGTRKPPEYILDLLQHRIREDLVNRRALGLPEYDAAKKNLPARSDYMGALAWLKAVKACLGEDVVFALDEALMCNGLFGGRNDEYLVWIYGDDKASNYNGVVVIGNHIGPRNVEEKDGIRYTDFNRTLSDAFANESLLDMQGITEALSKYYFANGESFDGLYVAPEYQERFDLLANEAIEYYDS
ncbi:MAG: helix-turn-helix domain-containing protein [Lachnospiraceae bacterium]|nr:helix-turn-helix domain-containing protein [Lachnospiraceae bacterium]